MACEEEECGEVMFEEKCKEMCYDDDEECEEEV